MYDNFDTPDKPDFDMKRQKIEWVSYGSNMEGAIGLIVIMEIALLILILISTTGV